MAVNHNSRGAAYNEKADFRGACPVALDVFHQPARASGLLISYQLEAPARRKWQNSSLALRVGMMLSPKIIKSTDRQRPVCFNLRGKIGCTRTAADTSCDQIECHWAFFLQDIGRAFVRWQPTQSQHIKKEARLFYSSRASVFNQLYSRSLLQLSAFLCFAFL